MQSEWVTDRFLSTIKLSVMRLSSEVELQATRCSTACPEQHVEIQSPDFYLGEA